MALRGRAGLTSSRIFLKKSSFFAALLFAGLVSAKEGSKNALVDQLRGVRAGGFEYAHYDTEGRMQWKVSSKGSFFEQDLSLRLIQPVLTMLAESGPATLSSAEAHLKREEQWIQMSGNVSAINFHGVDLQSGRLAVDMTKKMLTFSEHFFIQRALMQVEGEQGSYDGEKGILSVDGHSITEIRP